MKKYSSLLFVLLTGCSLWTNYEKPETPAPEKWENAAAATASAAWPDKDWWKQFNSASLTGQIETARAENFDMKAAVARVRQADAQARIAGAALLPSVDASAGANHDRSNAGVTGKPRLSNSYNATVSAAYELDFWGKNSAAAEAAESLADASRFDQQTVEITTFSAVADNYFDMLATQERLTIATDNLANAQQLLETFQKRFGAGVATALDVTQQKSIVDSQRAAIPPLALRLQQDKNAQALLLGKLPENVSVPTEKLSDLTLPPVVTGLPSELLQRRPDVQNAEAQLKSANANITVARAQFFPSIQLTADAGYASTALSQLFKPESMLFSLGGNALQPLFEGGLLEGQLELAKGQYDEELQLYRKAVLSAFSDVENSLSAVEQDEAEEKAQSQAVADAQKAYDLSRQQMGGGIVDITTVLNTQRTLFSAQDAYAQAKLVHLQAIVGLYNVLGGGWVAGAAAPQASPSEAAKPDAAPATPEAKPEEKLPEEKPAPDNVEEPKTLIVPAPATPLPAPDNVI